MIHVTQVAEMFGVKRQTVCHWVRRGWLRKEAPGWVNLADVQELAKFQPAVVDYLAKFRPKDPRPPKVVRRPAPRFDIEDTEEL